MSKMFSSSTSQKFTDKFPFEKRQAEASRIKLKYPDRVPVIVEKADKCDLASIDKAKFLVPSDLACNQFVYVIRKRIRLNPDQAIFIFVNNTLPAGGAMMGDIFKQHAAPDGFLYVLYSGESTFGAQSN